MAEREYTISIRIAAAGEAADEALGKVGLSLDRLKEVALGLGVAAGAALAGVGASIVKLAIDAAPLEGIRSSFENMTATFGLGSQQILEAMRTASAGMVTDADLMTAANRALTGAGEQLGKEFGESLPKLLEVARAAARATGEDATFLFESLVTGIKRASPMLIDNTGLQLKLAEANEVLAGQLGKTVEELTAEEKQIALLNATVQAGDKLIEGIGLTNVTAAEQMAQLRTSVENLKDRIGTAFLPVLQELLGPLGTLAEEMGPEIEAWAKELATTLQNEAVPALLDMAQTAIPMLLDTLKFLADILPPVIGFFGDLAGLFGTLQDWSFRFGESLRGVVDLIGRLLDFIGRIPGNIGDIIGRLPGIGGAGPEMPVLIGAPERRGVPMGIPEAVPGRERAEPGGGMRAAGHTFNINVTGTGDAAQDVERVVRTMELLYRVS